MQRCAQIPFTLRAIGDPRAVGALVRSLKNEIDDGSDYGMSVSDPDLLAFLRKHQNYPPDDSRSFDYGRPINEISPALAKLTGPGDRLWDGEAGARDCASGGTPTARNSWPRTALGLLPPGRPDRDRVEEAGIARFGPLFATAKDVVLGPVHEVELQSSDYANARAFIDFDRGRLLQFREAIGDGGKPANSSRGYGGWIRETGIDARNYGTVDGHDLQAWLIDNSRWNTLESGIRSGHPLNLGRETMDWLVRFERDPYDMKENEIGTFLFITREGGRGVMQVFPGGRRLRRPQDSLPDVGRERPAGFGGAGEEKTAQDADWESERLVILKAPGRGRAFLLNLETGRD